MRDFETVKYTAEIVCDMLEVNVNVKELLADSVFVCVGVATRVFVSVFNESVVKVVL